MDKKDGNQRPRESFQVDQLVDKYKLDRDIDEMEHQYEFQSDEESIFSSFSFNQRDMPLTIKKKFAINSESNNNKKIFKDVLRRFTEKTQTYEYVIKFNNSIEKTDESSIT